MLVCNYIVLCCKSFLQCLDSLLLRLDIKQVIDPFWGKTNKKRTQYEAENVLCHMCLSLMFEVSERGSIPHPSVSARPTSPLFVL